MTQKTNNDATIQTQLQEQLLVVSPLSHDIKTAVLIVSVILNLTVLSFWIAIQVTSQYDNQVVRLLLNS